MPFDYVKFFSTWHESDKRYAPRTQEFPLSIVTPVIPYEDGTWPLHSDARPFCSDLGCPCHEDESLVLEVLVNPYMDGLLTNEEGLRLIQGGQV